MNKICHSFTQGMDFTEKKKLKIAQYLMKNLNIVALPFQGNIYDIRSLNAESNTSICLDCVKVHNFLCCDGKPYSTTAEQAEKLEQHLDEILGVFPEDRRAELKAWLVDHKFISPHHVVQKGPDGNCFFDLEFPDGRHGCAIHWWCLQTGREVYEYKPYACSMAPSLNSFDIGDVENGKGCRFVFGLDKSISFPRSYSNPGETVCISSKSVKLLDKGITEGVSKLIKPECIHCQEIQKELHEFHPIYEDYKSLFIYLFGQEAYDFVDQKSYELGYRKREATT